MSKYTGKNAIIDSPSHYTQSGTIECIEAMQACSTHEEFCGHLRLTAIKYLWRLNNKGSALENAQKAQWYIDRLCEELSDEEEPNESEPEVPEWLLRPQLIQRIEAAFRSHTSTFDRVPERIRLSQSGYELFVRGMGLNWKPHHNGVPVEPCHFLESSDIKFT